MKNKTTSTSLGANLLVKLLPKNLYYRMVRNKIVLPQAFNSKFSVKLAETEVEFQEAFRILHDSYVDAGFMTPSSSGLRVTKYHALNTTYTLVAKYESKVIGTCSLIINGEFGMPVSSIYKSPDFAPGNTSIAEISSLAIDKQFRRGGLKALFLLLKGVWHLMYSPQLQLKTIYAAANPKHLPLYEGILQLEKQNKKLIQNYGFVDGAPALVFKRDLPVLESTLKNTYNAKINTKNLFRFFQPTEKGGLDISNICIKAPYLGKNLMEWDTYNKFFIQTGVHACLSLKEKNILDKHFPEYGVAV